MNLLIKKKIAKELKYLGFAIALAIVGFSVTMLIGLFYERIEYAKYEKKKADVEAEVAKWKKETLKRNKDLETEKGLALARLQIYLETNAYFVQDYKDFLLRWNLIPDYMGTGTVSYARSILREGRYNDHIRKLGILLREYESYSIPSNIDIMIEENNRLSSVRSFEEYRKYIPDKYSSIRKNPPIESASSVLITILGCYVFVRFIILIVQLIVATVTWVNKTSKIPINNTNENEEK